MTPRLLPRVAGVVLAGSHSWANTTFDRLAPKPLLPVGHRPLISYAISWLHDAGIADISVCGNRETQMLESRLHRDVPAGVFVTYHGDPMPRGAAGAVRDAAAIQHADVFVVVDGTVIPGVDLADLLQQHHASGAVATVVVHNEAGSHHLKNVQVPVGIYVFNRESLSCVPDRGFFDIKEALIPQLHRAEKAVRVHAVASASPRVLDSNSYLAVNGWMVEQLVAAAMLPDYVRCGSALVHHEALVASDVTFVGPVLVGPGARIASGAVIAGPTSIGREASVGAGVLVSRSALWRRSIVRDHAVADYCIVGDDAIVSVGVHTFGQVHPSLSRARSAIEMAQGGPQLPPVELLRRFSRALLGTAWSRSPAAQ